VVQNGYDIAIILTCFNRKEMTLRCMRELSKQSDNNSISFYVCDDNSTDGTYDAVVKEFPYAHIIKSAGNLYWCKGMHEAMKMATKEKHDLYLMVNDDVDFFSIAIKTMISTYEKYKNEHHGVVGAVASKITGEITYGGRRIVPFKIGKKSFGVKSNTLITVLDNPPIECDLTNWNCFLVDKYVIDKIGIIEKHYAHGVGDFDYSLRMRKKGFKINVAEEIIGTCERNEKKRTFYDAGVPVSKRLKLLFAPKGMPVGTCYRFSVRQNGILGIPIMTYRYIKIILCIMLKRDL